MHVLIQLMCQMFVFDAGGLFKFYILELIHQINLVTILPPAIGRRKADVVQTGCITNAKRKLIQIKLTTEDDRHVIMIKCFLVLLRGRLEQVRRLRKEISVLGSDHKRKPGLRFVDDQYRHGYIIEIDGLVADALIDLVEQIRRFAYGLIIIQLRLQRPFGGKVQLPIDPGSKTRVVLAIKGSAPELHIIHTTP